MRFEDFTKNMTLKGKPFVPNQKQADIVSTLEAKLKSGNKMILYNQPGVGASTTLIFYAIKVALENPGSKIGFMVPFDVIDPSGRAASLAVLQENGSKFIERQEGDTFMLSNGSTIRIVSGRDWESEYDYLFVDGTKQMRMSDWHVAATKSKFVFAHTSFKMI